MGQEWRDELVERALSAFAEDLDYAVALVSTTEPKPRRRAVPTGPRRTVWGSPPRFPDPGGTQAR